MRNNENGRSMVEMLGVLAIIGVLSAGGLAGYSKAMFKHKLNNTMEQITMLVTNIRTAYCSQRNYANMTEAKLVSLGVIPPVMGAAGSLTNPFKGGVTIAPADAKDAAGDATTGFTIQYTKLPREACISLATADFGGSAGSGFIGVDAKGFAANADNMTLASTAAIGTGATENVGTSGTRDEGRAYTMANAIAACSTETNTITWKFY